jgi:hypothetical protein
MKAIITKYSVESSRFSATDGDGHTVYFDRDNSLQFEDNHLEAVKKLCAKLKWSGRLIKSYLLHRGVMNARVWVWIEEQNARCEIFTINAE